jgi:hypothetical protein
MKRSIIAALLLATGSAIAELLPDTLTVTWNRQGTSDYINTNTYLSGVTYVLTNCQALTGTATQDLTGCGIYLTVGELYTSAVYQGSAQAATDGTFCVAFQIPPRPADKARLTTPMTTSLEFKLTNGTVTVIDKDRKKLYYVVPLGQ